MKLEIFILIIFQFKNYNFQIILPFEKNKNDIKDKFSFIENILDNKIITILNIGTPIQKIPTFITFNENYFYISNNKIYNNNLSKTYMKEFDKEKDFTSEQFKKGIISKESFIFKTIENKNIKIDNFSFILATDNLNVSLPSSSIGLKYKDYSSFLKGNLIYQLKDYSIINSYIFSIQFTSKNKGNLIIGNYPHEFDNKHYSKKYFSFCKAELDNRFSVFETLFHKIQYDNFSDDIKYANFSINIDGIIGSKQYQKYIKKTFFDKFLISRKCIEGKSKNLNYIYYECDKNIDISKFNPIIFFHKYLNYTFILDYNDLFEEINERLYFKVIFNSFMVFKWTLGVPFLNKYQFIFDYDKKIFGFYRKILNYQFHYIIILLFFLLLIIIVLIIILIKIISSKKTRRIRANELNDNFDYISKTNNFEYNKIIN